MKRRNFLASLLALPFAGKAIDTLAALAPPPGPFVGLIEVLQSTSIHGLSRQAYMFGIDPRIYRKIQLQALEGFKTVTEEYDWLAEEPS